MDAKDSLCKILNSLLEVGKPLKREILLDYILGRETPNILKHGLDNLETFACGDDKGEEHWMDVIDQAIEVGYLKVKSEGVGIMAKGKNYAKKPTPFELKSEDEEDGYGKDSSIGMLDSMMEDPFTDNSPQNSRAMSTHRKLAIIQAIDRKVALDEFASAQGMDFDEVMADVESLLATGTHLDLSYFAEEVLGEECIEELTAYYNSAKTDSLDKAMDEYGDVYSEYELRLGRALWRSKRIPTTSKSK